MYVYSLFNEAGFLEGDIGTSLFHGLEAAGRDIHGDLLAELRDEQGLFLEIDLTATLAGRIEFGSTNTVGVPASDLRFSPRYVAYTCHSRAILPVYAPLCNSERCRILLDMEKPRGKESPWARGDAYQQEAAVEGHSESFYFMLEAHGEIQCIFPLTAVGNIAPDVRTDIAGMTIIPLARALAGHDDLSAEDVRRAAFEISKRHNDAQFEFEEDRTKGRFKFRAFLQGKENPSSPWRQE